MSDMTAKEKKYLEKTLEDSVWCKKCKAKLKWKMSIKIAGESNTNKIRCHKCGNTIGHIIKETT